MCLNEKLIIHNAPIKESQRVQKMLYCNEDNIAANVFKVTFFVIVDVVFFPLKLILI
jgi:hypothetical protein